MNRTRQRAPDYGLYGEPAGPAFPDTLHIERISARSGPHRWRIAQHRHPALHQIFWIARGGGTLLLEDEDIALGGATALNLPAGSVHGFRFRENTEGSVVTLPATVLEPLRARLDPGRRLDRAMALAGTGDAPDMLEALHREHAASAPGRAEAMTALATLLCIWLVRRAGAGAPAEQAAAGDAAGRLFARFAALLDRCIGLGAPGRAGAERQDVPMTVTGFAGALSVSPPHLSRVCREQTGKPASALIRERQMLEARRLLAYTQQDVAGIAYRLGFADPGYFSRQFSAQTGTSPRAFRRGFTRPK